MADFTTGDMLVFPIGPTLDSTGAAVTGATWTAVNAVKPNGTTFTPIYAEIGNGLYKATVVSDQAGLWLLHSQTSVASVTYHDFAAASVASAVAQAADWTSARAAKLDNLGLASVTVSAPVASGGDVTIIQGDDYLNADGRALAWTASTWPALTGGSATLTVRLQGTAVLTKTMTVVDASHVRVDLTKTDTAALASGSYRVAIIATLADASVVTLVNAGLAVQKAGS